MMTEQHSHNDKSGHKPNMALCTTIENAASNAASTVHGLKLAASILNDSARIIRRYSFSGPKLSVVYARKPHVPMVFDTARFTEELIDIRTELLTRKKFMPIAAHDDLLLMEKLHKVNSSAKLELENLPKPDFDWTMPLPKPAVDNYGGTYWQPSITKYGASKHKNSKHAPKNKKKSRSQQGASRKANRK